MKCANCDTDALYIYERAEVAAIPYCASCLPSFLKKAARSGVLPTTEAHAATKQEVAEILSPEAPSARRKRPAKQVWKDPEPEPVVEETVEA